MRRDRREARDPRLARRAPAERGPHDRPRARHRSGRRADGQQRVRGRRSPARRHRASSSPGPRRSWWSSTTTELARLPGMIEMYRAALALIAGDPAGTIAHADRALDRWRPDATTSPWPRRPRWRAWRAGRPATSSPPHRGYAAAWTVSRRADTSPTCSAARSRWPTSSSPSADSATHPHPRARPGAGRAPRPATPRMRGTADMLVGLSQAAWHRNDLVAAAELLAGRGAGRAGRAAAAPLPLAGRHGPAPRQPTARLRRRARAARRGRAGLRRRLLTRGTPDPRAPAPASCSRRRPDTAPSTGHASTSRRSTTSCPTCASTSTSPWPASCSPTTAYAGRGGPGEATAPGAAAGGGRGRRTRRDRDRGGGPAGAGTHAAATGGRLGASSAP